MLFTAFERSTCTKPVTPEAANSSSPSFNGQHGDDDKDGLNPEVKCGKK